MRKHNVNVSPELLHFAEQLEPGTIADQSHRLGIRHGEPLMVAMECLLRYAKAYREHQEQPLTDDGVLGPCWLNAVSGLRGLLNGDGAVAMERNITTDSKDNGVIESLFWAAMEEAGFEESDL